VVPSGRPFGQLEARQARCLALAAVATAEESRTSTTNYVDSMPVDQPAHKRLCLVILTTF